MTPELEHAKEMERHKREALNSLVREQVIHTLGEPGDLLSVQVRPLWGTNYRVNVFAGVSIACARMTHSFFLVTDGDGNILEATPKIERQY
jgi:ribosomal protein L19